MRRLCCVCVLLGTACASNDGDDDAGDEMPARQCETETRDDTYAVGLAKDGERLRVAFVDAQPKAK